MIYAEHLDDEDRAWLDTYLDRDDGAAMVEGFLAVIVWVDESGLRRWMPITSLEASTEVMAGLWAMASQATINHLLDQTHIPDD
jgi:hypothetical protein